MHLRSVHTRTVAILSCVESGTTPVTTCTSLTSRTTLHPTLLTAYYLSTTTQGSGTGTSRDRRLVVSLFVRHYCWTRRGHGHARLGWVFCVVGLACCPANGADGYVCLSDPLSLLCSLSLSLLIDLNGVAPALQHGGDDPRLSDPSVVRKQTNKPNPRRKQATDGRQIGRRKLSRERNEVKENETQFATFGLYMPT